MAAARLVSGVINTMAFNRVEQAKLSIFGDYFSGPGSSDLIRYAYTERRAAAIVLLFAIQAGRQK